MGRGADDHISVDALDPRLLLILKAKGALIIQLTTVLRNLVSLLALVTSGF